MQNPHLGQQVTEQTAHHGGHDQNGGFDLGEGDLQHHQVLEQGKTQHRRHGAANEQREGPAPRGVGDSLACSLERGCFLIARRAR